GAAAGRGSALPPGRALRPWLPGRGGNLAAGGQAAPGVPVLAGPAAVGGGTAALAGAGGCRGRRASRHSHTAAVEPPRPAAVLGHADRAAPGAVLLPDAGDPTAPRLRGGAVRAPVPPASGRPDLVRVRLAAPPRRLGLGR